MSYLRPKFKDVKESKSSLAGHEPKFEPRPIYLQRIYTNLSSLETYPDCLAKLLHAERSGRGAKKTQRQFEGIEL